MGRVIKQDFANVMKNNIEIYANEVNEDRAIPSIMDGLKPVQRRILYWLSNNKGTNYLGSAEITGGVLGSFHPHGDSSVYGALVRLSQPLIMAYPLIDFHGNNGSLTDPPAAMRYTKAKLSRYGQALLTDINVNGVVEWQDNYNETQKEPKYLLGTLGTLNLLINPSIGIGVGLASNFTCHNIDDVKYLVKYRMEHPNCSFEDMPKIYPQFHHAGVIVNEKDIPNIYKTGKGTVILRANYHWKDGVMYVTEMPYRVDATMVKKYLIAHPIKGIADIYENNGQLKIYLEKGADEEEIERQLLKKTALQNSYSVNMTATDMNGKPRVWTLLEILDTHIALQHKRIIKVAENNKAACAEKLHINEGLEKALDDIDEVIRIIREADSPALAEYALVERLNIDNVQAKAILDIRLGRLTHMEIDAVRQTIASLKAQIEHEEEVISSKELRESMYMVEMSNYTDVCDKTPHFDWISVGTGIGHVYQDGYLIVNGKEGYQYASYEDAFEDGIIPMPFKCDTMYYIVTNKHRVFLRKGTDFLDGAHEWKEILKLEDGEEFLFLAEKGYFDSEVSSIELKYENRVEKIHPSHISVTASQRGKRFKNTKEELLLVTPYFLQM